MKCKGKISGNQQSISNNVNCNSLPSFVVVPYPLLTLDSSIIVLGLSMLPVGCRRLWYPYRVFSALEIRYLLTYCKQARIQKCGLGGVDQSSAEGTWNLNGGAEGTDGGRVWGDSPSPEKFWHVPLRNGAFWCILEHVLDQI